MWSPNCPTRAVIVDDKEVSPGGREVGMGVKLRVRGERHCQGFSVLCFGCYFVDPSCKNVCALCELGRNRARGSTTEDQQHRHTVDS